MTSPSAPGGSDSQSPVNSGQDRQPTFQDIISPQPVRGKEKKRVGFANDGQLRSEDFTTSPFQVTPSESQPAQDYFSFSPGTDTGASSTPMYTEGGGPAQRESFNKAELTAALTNIFTPDRNGSPTPPTKPRPVLRKQTVLDTPEDLLSAPLQSEVEAKYRADRLAFAVGSASEPVSRRGSLDAPDSGIDSPFDHDNLLGTQRANATGTNVHDFVDPTDASGLRPRRGAQQAANDLVRTHIRRASPLSQPSSFPRSGTSTPLADDLEYVPRPEKYKGGILGSLLKLYNAEEKSRALGGDFSAASTPNRTPNGSPPTSRPSTPLGSRPRSWAHRSHSSTTLNGLIGPGFMLAAPGGAKDISDAVTEKIRQERERERPKKRSRSKQKLEEFRITVHIAQIMSRHQYLLKLCRALMMYGAPTHRLEAYMRMSARVLAIEGQFMYLPGTMIISFDDSNTHTTEMKIIRSPQGVDLGRLRDVHEIYKNVVHDLTGAEEATARLNEVIGRKDKFPIWVRILLFGVASASVAPFGFEGRYIDMPICFILGCMVGFLQLYIAPSNELYANVFEITAAVLTSFLSRMFGSINGGSLFCFSALAQASIALILPGYIVLCASLELQSHQMVSGSVRMVYALIYSLFLGYGITIGSVIYGYMDDNAISAVHCSTGPEWYTQRPGQDYFILFVLPFTLCLCAINQAKWRQTPVMVFISLAGYVVNNFSSRHFAGNTTLSGSLGALCIGVLANLYSRLGRYSQNFFLDIWEKHFQPRIQRLRGRKRRQPTFYFNDASAATSSESLPKDPEIGHSEGDGEPPLLVKRARQVGYGLAAAAMLPAIFVQVPSGLAVGGSLLSGVTNADQITRNETLLSNGTIVNGASSSTPTVSMDMNSTAFNVLFSVIQVAISISVGLSLSALIVYPFGKRRSGLFSF